MYDETCAVFTQVWVQKVCVEPWTVIGKCSDGATDEVGAFVCEATNLHFEMMGNWLPNLCYSSTS